MLRRNMLLGGAVLWLTACGVGQAVLKTDQETYAPGSELKLNLENESLLQSLGFNLCFSTLQRHEGEAWTAVPRRTEEEGFCQAIQYGLKPGERTEHLRHLPAELPAGEYRYLTNVEWDGERQELVSNTFDVTSSFTP